MKFIEAKTKAGLQQALANNTVSTTDIAFILDTNQMYANGKYYNFSSGNSEDTYTDLSYVDVNGNPQDKLNTANCYVIHKPGLYKFPLVYGNAIKNGIDNTQAYTNKQSSSYLCNFVNYKNSAITIPYISGAESVQVSISDFLNPVNFVVIDSTYVKFEVSSIPTRGGNALVSILDTSGVVMWSWHLWFTLDNIETVAFNNYDGVTFNFMSTPLGAVKDSKNNGFLTAPYYQFGRPTPSLRATDSDTDAYATSYGVLRQGTGTSSAANISVGIKNPTVLYKWNSSYYYNWFDSLYAVNIWDNGDTTYNNNIDATMPIKTIYDPCPVGFCVPPSKAFTGFTATGENVYGDEDMVYLNGDFYKGFVFQKDNAILAVPALGYIYNANNISYITTMCAFWSCDVSSIAVQLGGYCLQAGEEESGSESYYCHVDANIRRGYALNIMPVKEK